MEFWGVSLWKFWSWWNDLDRWHQPEVNFH